MKFRAKLDEKWEVAKLDEALAEFLMQEGWSHDELTMAYDDNDT